MDNSNPLARRGFGKWPAVLLALIVTACAGVLGIEDRELDGIDTYPRTGYRGCTPTTGCADCLEVHRPECEARAACEAASAAANAAASCFSCVCDSCLESVVDCRMDPACGAVWQCLQDTRCEFDQNGGNACTTACASVIQEHGGVGSGVFQAARAIRECAVGEGCLACLAPEPSPPSGCNPQNGCSNCANCFQQCICSGDSFSACQDSCADAPPVGCSPGDSCVGCNTCFETCACQGGTFEECTVTCQAPDVCSVEAGCDTCASCLDACLCEGGVDTECQLECESVVVPDRCAEDGSNSGELTCGGCTSCLADCTCSGDTVEACMDGCGLVDCCDTLSCSSALVLCSCSASIEACGGTTACDDSNLGCGQCACGRCPDKFALCEDTPGCESLFDCMTRSGCQGSACADECTPIASNSGAADAFAAAEALWACTSGQGCNCNGLPPPAPVTCGSDNPTSCAPYLGPNYSADACCSDAAEIVVGEPSTYVPCGVDLSPFFFNSASKCAPLNREYRPDPNGDETCPGLTVSQPPYDDGTTLEGCCRAGTGLCGLWDPLMGIGCMDAAIFGQSQQPCL